ncbi:MAG: hypothetical protein ACX93T_00285 [Bacteroidota bacterium]
METKEIEKTVGSIPRRIAPVLFLLLTSCMNDHSWKPNDNRHASNNVRRDPPQKSVRETRERGHMHCYDHGLTTQKRVPDYGVYTHLNSWQGIAQNRNTDSRTCTQLNQKHNTATQSNVVDEGCKICAEEEAFKDYGKMRCTNCKNYVCSLCYEKILNSSEEYITHDYNSPMSVHTYQLKAQCPFCQKSF